MRGWSFIAGLLVGCCLAAGTFFSLVFGLAGTPTAASAAAGPILALKRQLATEAPSPKVLFLGGSSVDLGISARRFEQVTGVTSRNLGLWVSLGLPYLLQQARTACRPGDVVVLALEFELLDWPGRGRRWADPQFLQMIFAEEAGYLRGLPWRERFALAVRLPLTWPLEAGLRPTGPRRSAKPVGAAPKYYDHWGDRTDNTRQPRADVPAKVREASPRLVTGFGPDPKGFPPLTEFLDWAHASGVKVVATFPNLAANAAHDAPPARDARERVLAFYDHRGTAFVGTFAEASFAPEDCFDTVYHLLDDAVARRTDRLTLLLKDHLPAGAFSAAPP